MTRRREAGLLACPLIQVATLVLLVPSASAQICSEAFTVTTGSLSGFDSNVDITTDVYEKASTGTEMYTLSWDDCENVVPPEITDAEFTKYFTVDDTQSCSWVVSVNDSLIGVPDYPDPTATLSTTVTFTGFTTIDFTNCDVTLYHDITDQNTQMPEPEELAYTVDIKEDLSPGYTIAGFSTSVHDKDGTSPNNQFSVLVDNADCPLEATQVSYTSGQNPQLVEYQLLQAVDYEATETITCNMIFKDDGSPTLGGGTTITINVIDVDDEPPEFEFEYYFIHISSVVVPGEALDVQPAPISATDGDTDINATITYSMRNANEDVNGLEYFTINTITGEITLTQDLQEDFLLNERVLFFVEASDGSLQASTVLEVMLPPVPTTTASTTPATTCEPCTCPTPTTELPTECPTTPTESTCTPCPSETTTECVCPTTPTEGPTTTTTVGPTVTWDPNLPSLTFKKESYVADIYPSHTEFLTVEVEDIEGYTVEYSIRGEGDTHFIIDANTGMISVNEADPPPVDLYQLQALATITTVPTQQATTMVTINVLPFTIEEVIIQSSVIRATVNEGDEQQDLGDIRLYSEASSVCVTGAEPSNLKDRFSVKQKSATVWTLKKSGALDYEETHEVTLSIRAYTGQAPDCADLNDAISPELLKSEALAIITVNDVNDEAPVFSSDSLVAGYPINEGLKRVMGPVVSVHADDKDSEDVTYSVTGTDAAEFTVDEVTGDVYGVEGLTCDDQCEFNVTASDSGGKKDQVSVKVLPLDTEHVFTIVMPDTALSEVDDKLKELSSAAGAQISMLYVSPTETTTRWGRTRYRRATTTSLQVHVYSIKDGELMSQAELNSALEEGSSDVQAEAFVDAEVFAKAEEVDTTGLKVAVGVLGGLLGVVLIAAVAFLIYKKRKGSSGAKTEKPPAAPISTLGQAYNNPSYTNDTSQVNLGSGSLGHKSNGSLNGYPGGGSLNGYTSAEVHSHPDQDSPPLHRSPLAPPTDSFPLRSRDSHQQGGLKRTDPGAPEFYGSSSPAPPPSFAASSSHPIYAEIKKPKSSTSTERKYLDNSDDDGDLGDTKFASVKHSPPPRRSVKLDDDDDDDADGDVAYPGGKHVGFQDEPDEDEKKSVAFKVKVETKEIEAENKGPAQKKAEAAALMEANRQKMQEEGDDEDDDEEEEPESMKL